MTLLGQTERTERTTSFTPEQKAIVDEFIPQLADKISQIINEVAPGLRAMDDRPRQTYSPEQPDVYFPYVAQALLEDLIAELQERV